jgi:DNA (cytosine-5)-methyltransferase 1
MEDFGPLFRSAKRVPATHGGERLKLTTAGLFAGIGGLELGFHQAGHETALLCEPLGFPAKT